MNARIKILLPGVVASSTIAGISANGQLQFASVRGNGGTSLSYYHPDF